MVKLAIWPFHSTIHKMKFFFVNTLINKICDQLDLVHLVHLMPFKMILVNFIQMAFHGIFPWMSPTLCSYSEFEMRRTLYNDIAKNRNNMASRYYDNGSGTSRRWFCKAILRDFSCVLFDIISYSESAQVLCR